jgi:hypothetical protein
MEELFEPTELAGIAEDDPRDSRAVRSVGADHLRPKTLDELAPNLRILAEEPVDDCITRDRRRPVTCERLERLALTGPDPAGDRDRDWPLAAR